MTVNEELVKTKEEIQKVDAELGEIQERQRTLLKERRRLRDLLNELRTPIPEDTSQRYVCEAKVVGFITRNGTWMAADVCDHGRGRGCTKNEWKFRVQENHPYRVGDTIRLEFRFAARKESKKRCWWPKILPPPNREDISDLMGYDS